MFYMETTTIQISKHIKESLDKSKLFERETYNEIISRMMEDMREINEQTKKDIQRALKEYKEGKFKTHEQVGLEMGF